MATSSTHSKQVADGCMSLAWFVFVCSISLFISSISVAYCVTASIPPCLMLLCILMVLVFPREVRMLAVRLWLSLSVMFHSAPVHPWLLIVYMMASSQARSYAFVTSRKVMNVGCLLFLLSCIVSFILRMWSVVPMPFLPPACSSDILMFLRMHVLISLSYSLPILLDRVMPLSLLHFPFAPLPLYSLMTLPFCHCVGMFFVDVMWLSALRMIVLVCLFASMNAMFGMLSGPVALFLFSLAITLFSSWAVNGGIVSCAVVFRRSDILSSIILVQVSYPGSSSLAWYSCS